MDDEVGHVADEVGGEADVEEHEEYREHLLPGVPRMQVSVADGGEGGDGPVHGVGVAQPYASLLEVRHQAANPRVIFHSVVDGHPVIDASRRVYRKQCHLRQPNPIDFGQF